MPDVELIDGNDILADASGTVMPRIELAIARAREYDRPVWVWFTFNITKVTVAADSDPVLLYNTIAVQGFNPNKSAAREVGPYPAQLTFDESKAQSYRLIWRKKCVAVRAYQLDLPGWVERIDSDGEPFTNWYGFPTNWYVKDPDAGTIFIVPHDEFTLCPCSDHHLG